MRARPLGDRAGGETGQTLDVAGLHRNAVEFAPCDASELLPQSLRLPGRHPREPEHAAERIPRALLTIIQFNPMYSILSGYSELIQGDGYPPLYIWLTAAAWAAAVVVIGFLFFMSREREFTVRLV